MAKSRSWPVNLCFTCSPLNLGSVAGRGAGARGHRYVKELSEIVYRFPPRIVNFDAPVDAPVQWRAGRLEENGLPQPVL